MFYPEFTMRYLERVKENPEKYGKEYETMMQKTKELRRINHGKLVPMTYQGMYFEKEQEELFQHILKTMAGIGRKVVNEFLENPSYRKGFHFSPEIEEMILWDPGFDMPVPVARYDIFYNGGEDFMFCELNTDGSSAMNEDLVLGGILSDTTIMREMEKAWTIRPYELFDSLIDRMLSYYFDIHGKTPESVAIVDFTEYATILEFEVFKERFEKRGIQTVIADVRKMRYEKGVLYASDISGGEEIAVDLCYRRMVTGDAAAHMEEISDFLKAYRENAITVFGPFRSQVMHSKLIFRILCDPVTKRILSEEENAFVDLHVPKTFELADEEDQQRILEEKDKYILKPYNSYGSQGIFLGREHNEKDWKNIVLGLPLNTYIYQEYVDVDPTPFVEFKEGKAEVNPFAHVIGLFMYFEEFAGSYTRIGQQGLISGAREYYTAPVFLVEKRSG